MKTLSTIAAVALLSAPAFAGPGPRPPSNPRPDPQPVVKTTTTTTTVKTPSFSPVREARDFRKPAVTTTTTTSTTTTRSGFVPHVEAHKPEVVRHEIERKPEIHREVVKVPEIRREPVRVPEVRRVDTRHVEARRPDPVRPVHVDVGRRPVSVRPIYVRPWNDRYHGHGWNISGWQWRRYPPIWAYRRVFHHDARLGWFAGAGTDVFVYVNPYWSAPPDPFYDYSQPIPVPDFPPDSPDAPPGDAPPDGPPPEQPAYAEGAATAMDSARAKFRQGDYAGALADAEGAIRAQPGDPTLHEFRALALFALKRYPEATAALYAVLSAGPGWDWPTMIALYPDVNTYTAQLRDLEAARNANPNAGELRFLLAYHYLTMGHQPAAIQQLQEVVKLVPQDKLAAQILTALTQPDTGGAAEAPPPPPGG